MLDVAFLWHMHQPFYKDMYSGEYYLPWVRLHSIKDYYGMAALALEREDVRVTFNLVPSLLLQIRDYAEGLAVDRNLEISMKDPKGLDPQEVDFMISNFFRCFRPTMIDPHPRYKELFLKMRGDGSQHRKRNFPVSDLRDLQVWSTLSWFHRTLRKEDPVLKGLFEKGRDFTEGEKKAMLDKQREVIGRVIPLYRRLADEGRAELTTSPFYHPILPLLCRMESALEAMPSARLPVHKGPYVRDAQEQVSMAVAQHEKIFGRKPSGMWPPEGSVSDDMLPILLEEGISWAATDEGILENSVLRGFSQCGGGDPPVNAGLYTPYRLRAADAPLAMFFRDRALSDLIGFSYYGMDPEAAAADFVSKLLKIEAKTGGTNAVVTVALDGENPWEHYGDGGVTFLRSLYSSIASEQRLKMTTFSNHLKWKKSFPVLPRLAAGSWINSNFGIWIGSPQDNTAWDYLGRARQWLGRAEPKEGSRPAWESVYAAEGSDWFWWYGDDFFSEEKDQFDFIFRRNLSNVFRFMGEPVPPYLEEAIISDPRSTYTRPTGFMDLVLDGKATNYFEWSSSGRYVPSIEGTTMGKSAARIVKEIRIGMSADSLCLRVDTSGRAAEKLAGERQIRIEFPDTGTTVKWSPSKGGGAIGRAGGAESALGSVCVFKVAEIAVPFASMGARPGDLVRFSLEIAEKGAALERHPRHGFFEFAVPTENFEMENWQV